MTVLPSNPDVIVVGAGTAGLAAAKALRQKGLSVIVLEAAPGIGGRCITDTSTFSAPFDRGGSWLHSAPINPLARIAEERGAVLHKTPWEPFHVHVAGHNLTKDEVADYDSYSEQMWDAINERGAKDPDISMADCLPEHRWVKTAAHAIAQHHASDADVTSARDCSNYDEHEGDWLVSGGLGRFVRDLHDDVPVQTNCPVQTINNTGPRIRVTTPEGTLEADQLIITVSTGVLASGAIRFVPPLPVQKQEAVDQLPMGLLNKIGIDLDPSWTEMAEGQMLEYHTKDDAFCSILFGFCGSSLAVGFVGGRVADAFEKDGPGTATAFCREALGAIFGSDIAKSIHQMDETAWRQDSLALGSYSYAKPGGAAARAVLSQPMEGRIFFAGEATMTHTYSTVHGAYQSGQRAADEILALRGKP